MKKYDPEKIEQDRAFFFALGIIMGITYGVIILWIFMRC